MDGLAVETSIYRVSLQKINEYFSVKLKLL